MFNLSGAIAGPIVILGVVSMTILTKPSTPPINSLKDSSLIMDTTSSDAALSNGAEVMISSVPVEIQNQMSGNIFKVKVPNDKGEFSTVILQKLGNRFIGAVC